MKRKLALRKAKSFDELLDMKYGKVGTAKRDNFEKKARKFVVNEMRKRGAPRRKSR